MTANPTERAISSPVVAGLLMVAAFVGASFILSLLWHGRDGLTEVFGRTFPMPALIAASMWPISLTVLAFCCLLIGIGLRHRSTSAAALGFGLLGLGWFILTLMSCRFGF